MKPRRAPPTPAPPTVPELVLAPELAAVVLLEHALDVVREALLAEHPALADDFRRPNDDGPVLSLANTICLRAPALRDALRRYRQAVRLATSSNPTEEAVDEDDRTF
jgi:hypothetical protein